MKKASAKSILVSFTITALFLSVHVTAVFAQEKPVVISIGQPNIWSLEQAHYLLARMHRQNLDLQTAPLGSIDPNETNSQRVEIVKMLLSAGFSFDEAVGLNNSLLKDDKEFNSERRRDLLEQRSDLQSRRTKLSSEITELKIAIAKEKADREKIKLQAAIDAKTEERTAVETEIKNINDELVGLSSTTGTFKGGDSSLSGFDKDKLPTGDLSGVLPKTAVKPSIAASQRLENYVGMQYEIIAKQLTLLRDEVGPGERLVFLELPQSINLSQDQEKNKYYQALRGITGMSTNDSADNKMAQVWWRIAGYTQIDKDALFKQELDIIDTDIRAIQDKISNQHKSELYKAGEKILLLKRDTLQARLIDLCKRKATLAENLDRANKLIEEKGKQIENLRSEKNPDEGKIKMLAEEIRVLKDKDCAPITDELVLLDGTIDDTRDALQAIFNQQIKLDKEDAKLVQSLAALYSKYEKLTLQAERNKIKEQQSAIDRVWQGGSQNRSTVVDQTMQLLNRNEGFPTANNSVRAKTAQEEKDGRKYIPLAGTNNAQIESTNSGTGLLRDRSVRIIDIIPRQNAVNVDTTKESVKASGVVAAFSFLFGFGGNVRYQRQKETFDEFLNQELYTSGFGKGDIDFGWSFFPFNGSKQLAPGLRTTYAIAIIPDDAETLVMKAQGCYFPRREKQPADYDAANSWKTGKESSACLSREQVFVIPVPGGASRGSDFYVTEVRYTPVQLNGQRMIASINGENISPQIGVTIDGIPLVQAVGLAQTGVESILADKVREVCDGQICGRFERINSSQIVISFKMPDGFKGTPRIGLIAPGKAIEINNLNLSVNGKEDVKLDSEAYMFGTRPPVDAPPRAITDFRAAPDPDVANGSQTIGIITGKFGDGDTFFVNGKTATVQKEAGNLRIIAFKTQEAEQLVITLVPGKGDAISKSFPNSIEPRIISATIADVNRDGAVPVVTVIIDGSGFSNPGTVRVNGTALPPADVLTASPGQVIIKVRTTDAVFAVDIEDAATKKLIRTIITVPPAPAEGGN